MDELDLEDLLLDVLAPEKTPDLPSPLAPDALDRIAMLYSDDVRSPGPFLRVRYQPAMEKIEAVLTRPNGRARIVVAPTLGQCLELLETPDEGETLILGEEGVFLCGRCSGVRLVFDVLEDGEEPEGDVVTSPAGFRGVIRHCPECGGSEQS